MPNPNPKGLVAGPRFDAQVDPEDPTSLGEQLGASIQLDNLAFNAAREALNPPRS